MVFLKKPVKIGTGECCLKNGLKKGLQKFWCSPTNHRLWQGSRSEDHLNISPCDRFIRYIHFLLCNHHQSRKPNNHKMWGCMESALFSRDWQVNTRSGGGRFCGIAIAYLPGHEKFFRWSEEHLSQHLTRVRFGSYSQSIPSRLDSKAYKTYGI